MTESDFATLRDALVEARRDAKPIGADTPSPAPTDLGSAYRVQQAVLAAFGAGGGWKIGAVTAAQRQAMRVDVPVASAIPRRFMRENAESLRLDDFIAPLVECEFAFRIARDLPPRAGNSYTRDEVGAAVGAMHFTIELVDPRLPRGSGTLAEVADGFNNGALVVGDAVRDWRSLDMPAIDIVLEHSDGDGWSEVAKGSARAVLDGDPFAAVVMLANAQPASGPGLRAGDIVTTGSCTGAPPLPGRGTYRARYMDVGGVSVAIV